LKRVVEGGGPCLIGEIVSAGIGLIGGRIWLKQEEKPARKKALRKRD